MEYIIMSSNYFTNAVNIKNRIYVLKDELKDADYKQTKDILRRIDILKSMYYEAISIGRFLKEKGERICEYEKTKINSW